jgi:hypothetical protein
MPSDTETRRKFADTVNCVTTRVVVLSQCGTSSHDLDVIHDDVGMSPTTEGERMSEKLNAALANLEMARATALETAIADRAYRLCVVLDGDGPIQRGVNRARKMLVGKTPKELKAKK